MNVNKPHTKGHSLIDFKNIHLSKSMLNFIFITALILLLVISVISYNQVKNLIISNNWVIHTHEVIETTDSSLYRLIDIESHQRAYLITGDTHFLDEIDISKTNLQTDLEQLKQLTADSGAQSTRVALFSDLVNKRLEILSQVMQLKSSGKLNSQEGRDLFNRSQDTSSKVKGLGQEIKSIEFVLLNERNSTALSKASTSSYILVIGSILSIGSLLIAFFLASTELSKRKRTELVNQHTQTRLRQIIESASDMIAALDKEYHFIIFNQAYQREFKYIFDKSLRVGMSLDEAFSDVPDNKRNLMQTWKDSLVGREQVITMELDDENKKNTYELSSSFILGDDNEHNGVVHSVSNISKRIQEHFQLLASYEQQAESMRELQDKNQQITLLVEMSDIMLASSSQEELSDIMAKYSERLLPFARGYLFIMHPSRNYLEKAASWGNPSQQEIVFTPDQCWAIRLGRLHQVGAARHELLCNHIGDAQQKDQTSLLCIPLMAQNDIYGLLYLEVDQENPHAMGEDQRLLITAFAELMALALANVRLRENLRHQSIRDPLTGLYNRRYLEDFLFKQTHQAERNKASFSILMLDLDHFKKINDTYGHDAGDAALKELGTILQEAVHMGDIASRYGGEEFIVMFYDVDIDVAKQRAEEIRQAVSRVQIKYGAQHIGPITISIGIAGYPEDGKTIAELIEAADKALYQAKNSGRNKVVLFNETNWLAPNKGNGQDLSGHA